MKNTYIWFTPKYKVFCIFPGTSRTNLVFRKIFMYFPRTIWVTSTILSDMRIARQLGEHLLSTCNPIPGTIFFIISLHQLLKRIHFDQKFFSIQQNRYYQKRISRYYPKVHSGFETVQVVNTDITEIQQALKKRSAVLLWAVEGSHEPVKGIEEKIK